MSVANLESEPPVPVLIEAWAQVQPDATFCVEVAGRSLTYAGFVAEANGWSRALAAAGAGRGDIVLTMIPTSCDSLAVWMGIARLRAVDAAVTPTSPGKCWNTFSPTPGPASRLCTRTTSAASPS
jgi:acyl-CoA synthetase (AMP-forming)/AMP-acid ligase II